MRSSPTRRSRCSTEYRRGFYPPASTSSRYSSGLPLCREGGHSVDDLPLRGRFHPGKPYVSPLETFGTRDGEPDGGASEFLRRLFLPGWTEARRLRLLKWVELSDWGGPQESIFPERAGGVVAGPDWKKARFKEGWYRGDTVNYSIGQGFADDAAPARHNVRCVRQRRQACPAAAREQFAGAGG